MIYAVCFLVAAFLLVLLTTPAVIRLSQNGIGLDDPNESRKHHDVPISRLGGLPIMLAASVGLAVILSLRTDQSGSWLPILVGSVMMYGLGLWDDLKRVGARKKLAVQIITASICY